MKTRLLPGVMAATADLPAACSSSSNNCRGDDSVSCVWAGTGEPGFNGEGLGLLKSRLYWPVDISIGPDGTPWVLDWNNLMVRNVTPDGKFKLAIGDFLGDGPPDQSDLTEPGAPGETVRLNYPADIVFGPDYGIELDAAGNLYIADTYNERVRLVGADPSISLASAANTP